MKSYKEDSYLKILREQEEEKERLADIENNKPKKQKAFEYINKMDRTIEACLYANLLILVGILIVFPEYLYSPLDLVVAVWGGVFGFIYDEIIPRLLGAFLLISVPLAFAFFVAWIVLTLFCLYALLQRILSLFYRP